MTFKNAIYHDQKYEFVMGVASGQTKLESIISWLENHPLSTPTDSGN
jgi:phosphodiesterase/alkaline phosphatase D-like protein